MAENDRPQRPSSKKQAPGDTGAAGGWDDTMGAPPAGPLAFPELEELLHSAAAFPDEPTRNGTEERDRSEDTMALPDSFITDFDAGDAVVGEEAAPPQEDRWESPPLPVEAAEQGPAVEVELPEPEPLAIELAAPSFDRRAEEEHGAEGIAEVAPPSDHSISAGAASALGDAAPVEVAPSLSQRAPGIAVASPPLAVDEEPTFLNDNGLFRKEGQRLARGREWSKLAAMTSAAVDQATWANLPETKGALLVDLARIYRDRLGDPGSAEDTFRRLAQIDAAHADAIDFLAGRYRERGDWRALYDLYAAAVEATWDPNQRLEWTRETVALATDKLRSPDLAIEAWERLFRLGDAVDETTRALSEVYRRAGRWDRLAEFLGKRAAQLQGAERIVALREIAEAWLSGMRDHDKAAEVLAEILAARPDDPLALSAMARVLWRRKDWEALAEMGARPLDSWSGPAQLDFRRLVADALWSAGDLERAVVAHERVLELDPNDVDALKAKEEYLERQGKTEALVGFLSERAERAATDGERAKILARAAGLAESKLDDPRLAVALWERRAAIEEGRLEAKQALARLYEALGELEGVAAALEGQLAATRNAAGRVELLRRLGDHYANRLGKDDKAEACWKEIAALVPDDRATRDELIALHRRRGDFEALDRTLSTQAWRGTDRAAVLGYWRAAAANIEDNVADPPRAIRAWLRVIDLAPRDDKALRALVGHHRAVGRTRELIAILEAELLVTEDAGARVERALEIAKLWEGEGDRGAALAAYERILRWRPTDDAALAAVTRLRAGTEASALEAAIAAESDGARRVALVRQLGELAPAGDHLGRFFALSRILSLSGHDPQVLDEVAGAAAEAGAWTDLAAVYLEAAARTSDPARRGSYQRELATIYEQRLSDPVRAFLVLLAIGHQPIAEAGALEALGRLAEATGRHEDLLALLDVAARDGNPIEERRAALRRRVEICEHKLGDATRAFHESVRLLGLDPHDRQALADARRLAEAKGLWRQLDALYAELSDRASTLPERIDLLRARHAVRGERLGDAGGALDQLLAIYRLDPEAPGITAELEAAADAQRAWDRVLPAVEARARVLGEGASPDELARVAALHEDKRGDAERAFELYAEAFVLAPARIEWTQHLERLAGKTGRADVLAAAWRFAAARASDPQQALDLHRRLTALYERLGRREEALDVHRRILQLEPSRASLDVVIEHDRAAGDWRELRDRLQQWTFAAAPADGVPDERIPRWLEIARLSRERLSDAETALATYARILEVDTGNEEAIAGVRTLTEGPTDPALELRRILIELGRAEGERRVELRLAAARIQETALDDADGAIATLRALIDETSADGPGYEPLARLLGAHRRWGERIDLIETHALALSDGDARIIALQQAVKECDEHPGAPTVERCEGLYRRLLEEQPGDAETRRRLASLYREAGRFDRLADLLKGALDTLPYGSFEEQAELEGELLRVYDRALERLDIAEELGAARVARDPDDGEAQLAVASLKLRRGDFEGWQKLREQHARRQPPALGALVLCHLAEACDEKLGQPARVANLYREARALDPSNVPAMEALKAIGRRARSWRATAALLPDPDERELSWAERASRLRARAANAADGATARGWLLRAVAIDPDHYPAWDAIADLRAQEGDPAAALEAQRASLAAYERATSPTVDGLREYAERIQRLAEAHRAAGDEAEAARMSLRAFQVLPSFAAAALTVADERLEEGQTEAAWAIYDRVLRDAETVEGQAREGRLLQGPTTAPIADAERLHAMYQRGALAARLGRPDEAIADLRRALRIDALHPGVLQALAGALGDRGRVAAAAQHYTQALLVVYEQDRRGVLYARLGRLWEDALGAPDEAGVCYDIALASGVEDQEVLLRGLRHYRRVGNADRALAVIDRLLPATTEARELAALWTERAAILGVTDEEKAIEAYDMALSYDPGNAAALGGLSEILERRGDWEQLLQIFEARIDSGGAVERAEALRSLARIADDHLHDPARAEGYLREAVELAPCKEDLERLISLCGDDPARAADRRAFTSSLLAISGPWVPRMIELGRMLVAQGERRWAWCLLSPLMSASLPDPSLKALVLELRKEFEKSDNSIVLTPETRDVVRHRDVDPTLLDVLGELGRNVVLGRCTTEQAGAGGVGRLDERTAVGKTFIAIAHRLGIEGALLSRAQELPEPYAILDGATPHVVVRAELLQLLSVAETSFLFASLLELSRPGARTVMSLPPAERPLVVRALFHAVGLVGAAPEIEALAARIREAEQPARLAAWAEALRELAAQGPELGERFAHGLVETARRVGLVAAADLRFVARLLTRIDDSLPKLTQTVVKLAELDDFLGAAPPVRALLGFAASDTFGRALSGG